MQHVPEPDTATDETCDQIHRLRKKIGKNTTPSIQPAQKRRQKVRYSIGMVRIVCRLRNDRCLPNVLPFSGEHPTERSEGG